MMARAWKPGEYQHLSPCAPLGELPTWLSGKEYAYQCRRCKRHGFDPWVRKIPWRRKWQPTAVFLHGQRSVAATAYGVAKSRTRLSTHTPLVNWASAWPLLVHAGLHQNINTNLIFFKPDGSLVFTFMSPLHQGHHGSSGDNSLKGLPNAKFMCPMQGEATQMETSDCGAEKGLLQGPSKKDEWLVFKKPKLSDGFQERPL